VLRRIVLFLHPHREFSGRVLIYFLLRLIFSDLGVDEDDDRRLVRAFCRALGKYYDASFVFTRLLGFLDDARNDDEIESGASWRGVVEQVSASSGDDEVTSKGGRFQQLDVKREHATRHAAATTIESATKRWQTR
jgi:hypothetical protein